MDSDDSATEDAPSTTQGVEQGAPPPPLNNNNNNNNNNTDTQIDDDDDHLPALMTDSDSDDEDSGWNMGGYSSGSSDTSDGEYVFNGNVSDASDDSSLGDDDDDYGMFEMLTNHFDVFNNFVPAFFGVSLQMLYARIMENITLEEERDSPTPQHILDSLPSTKVTQSQVATSMSCCICFCDYVVDEELLQLPCTHIYHSKCILDWLKIKCTCPTCRCDLTTNINTNNLTEITTTTTTSDVSESSGGDVTHSSSENLVYTMDREHIYDTIERYNTNNVVDQMNTDNVNDISDMSSSNILNIDINSSAANDIRTPVQSVQQNLPSVAPNASTTTTTTTTATTRTGGNVVSGHTRNRLRTRYVTSSSSGDSQVTSNSSTSSGESRTPNSENTTDNRTRTHENRTRSNENRTRTHESRTRTHENRIRSNDMRTRTRIANNRTRSADNRTRSNESRTRSNESRTRNDEHRSRNDNNRTRNDDSSIAPSQQNRSGNKSTKRFSRETEIW